MEDGVEQVISPFPQTRSSVQRDIGGAEHRGFSSVRIWSRGSPRLNGSRNVEESMQLYEVLKGNAAFDVT